MQIWLCLTENVTATLYIYWKQSLLLFEYLLFLSWPGSTAISTLVVAPVPVPIMVSLSLSGPAIPVFVSFSFPRSFPLPLSFLLPLAVPPLSLPLSLFFPFLPFPLKLQSLFLPLVLFFFEFLQSKTETGSAKDTLHVVSLHHSDVCTNQVVSRC